MDERDRYADIDGRRVHWREWGDESAPPLVLLHGSWLAAAFYDAIARELGAERRVYALDQRGHGETDHADDYSWPLWVEDIASFADDRNLERFDLVGHSMGADNALRFAGTHPERVRRLVLLEGGFGPWTSPEADHFWTTAFHLAPADGFLNVETYIDHVCELFPRSDRTVVAETGRHFVQESDGRWRWPHPADMAFLSRADPTPEEEATRRAAVTAPTLVVQAEHSELFVGDTYQRVAEELPQGRAALLPGAGHNLQWENVDGTVELITDFLTE
jgi:pimeloyl-ACP methyl ester carboxylesterase